MTGFLLLLVLEVLRNAFNHLTGRSAPPEISIAGFVDHDRHGGDQLVVRALRVARGRTPGQRDAARRCHCRRAATSGRRSTVIAALAGARAGLPILDPIAALVVAGFIGHAGIQIATDDDADPERPDRDVGERTSRQVVLSVRRRARLSPDPHARLGRPRVPRFPRLAAGRHAARPMRTTISHVVKDRLMARYPQIVDAVIHIEPPPRPAP